MSLQVWLPLNGNLNNYGVNGDAVISGTPSYGSNGKIGTYYLNTSNMISIYEPKIQGSKICTFAFWAYVVTDSIVSNWTLVARFDDQGTNSGSNMRFEVCPASYGNGVYCFSNHNNANYGLTTGCITSPAGGYYGKWVHFCFTSDGTTFTRYMDGVKIGTCNYDGAATLNGYFRLANNQLCYKQDVRIYDNCLSDREVKEISKGLVLHYPLNQPDRNENLILTSRSVIGGGNASGITSSYESDGSLKIISTSGNGNWRSLSFAQNSNTNVGEKLAVGNTYTISVDVKITEGTVLPTLFINSGNGYKRLIGNTSLNEWHRVYYTSTWATPGTDYGNISLHLGFSDAVGTYYFKNFKLEKGTNINPVWSPAPSDNEGWDSTIEYDCSGLGNNGIVLAASAPMLNDNSVRNLHCYKFSGAQYINCGRTAMITDAITVAWWGYMDSWSSYTRAISCTEGGGWNFEPNSGMQFPIYISSIGYVTAKDSTVLSSISAGWHHWVGTYDRTAVKIYRDGNLVGSTSVSAENQIEYNTGNVIFIGAEAGGSIVPAGSYFNGLVSDFRIYATALSADEIKNLYNAPITIANNGVLMTQGEVIEE